jgi:toxin ParE1/3/4
MAKIIWSPKALADLESVLDYISRNAPATARRFGAKLLARVDSLEAHPLLGGFIAEDETHTYREILQGNYRVIYRFDGQAAYVVAVHHAACLLDLGSLR